MPVSGFMSARRAILSFGRKRVIVAFSVPTERCHARLFKKEGEQTAAKAPDFALTKK
jgi:hypothetical protein